MIPTSIIINHRTLITQPASTKSFPHTRSNQNRNAATYSMHANSSLQQKQILPQDALQSQSVSTTEALSVHRSGVSRMSATQESSLRANSTTTLVTRQSRFPDLPPLEHRSLKSCSYLLKPRLSSTCIKTAQILPGVLRDVQRSVCRGACLSTSFVNLPWRREGALHRDSSFISRLFHAASTVLTCLPSPAVVLRTTAPERQDNSEGNI